MPGGSPEGEADGGQLAGRPGPCVWKEERTGRSSKSLAGACPVKFAKATAKRISLGASYLGSLVFQ